MLRFSKSGTNKRSVFIPSEVPKTPRGKAKSLAGFMLLEVMLSVFIVVVGVVFVIASFTASIRAFKASKSYLAALYLMENKMWQYEESGEIEEGSDSGKFEDYESAAWRVEAEEIEDLPLNETTIEVTLKQGEKKQKFAIATYFFNKE